MNRHEEKAAIHVPRGTFVSKEPTDYGHKILNGVIWPDAFLGHDRIIQRPVAWPSWRARYPWDRMLNDDLRG